MARAECASSWNGGASMASLAVARTTDAAPARGNRTEPPINRDHLARYTCGNVELELEVLQLFADRPTRYVRTVNSESVLAFYGDCALVALRVASPAAG